MGPAVANAFQMAPLPVVGLRAADAGGGPALPSRCHASVVECQNVLDLSGERQAGDPDDPEGFRRDLQLIFYTLIARRNSARA